MQLHHLTVYELVSIGILLLVSLWGLGYTFFAVWTNRIKSAIYKLVLCITLFIYCIYITVHLSFLFLEFDPLEVRLGVLAGYRSIASSTVFLTAVGIDSMVLQLFRVLDDRITLVRLNKLRLSFLLFYGISLLLTILNLAMNQNGSNTIVYSLMRYSRMGFVICVCLYDELQNVFITVLVYASITHSQNSKTTLKKTLCLIISTYPIDILGAICFVLAESVTPQSSLWQYRLLLLNGSVISVGIHLNFMVTLFTNLVNLTFSEKGKIISNKMSVKTKSKTVVQ